MNHGELEPGKSQMIDQEMQAEQNTTPEKLYPPSLEKQVNKFISTKREANSAKPEHARRDERNYAFAEDFFKRLFTERNTRTYQVESDEYKQTQELANKQFPVRPYWNLCMDGRVLSVLTNGATSGVGTSTRVPGAMHREFVRGKDGKTFLRDNSTFAGLLETGIKKSPEGVIAEIFDSHIKCAARKAEENQAGKNPTDYGLMEDVLSKKEMSLATQGFVNNKFGDEKRVITIQTSFNPENGYMYMGLETDNAIALAAGFAHGIADKKGLDRNKVKPEYTAEVLEHLLNERVIISTEAMVHDERIKQIFEEHGNFSVDWRHNYVESAQNFWEGIAKMRETALPYFDSAVRVLYPHADELEIQERAIILLTNAFNGYLNNKDGYSYDEHKEQFIKIYEGGQPPYDISAFVLNPHMKDLPANIELAAGLVRMNRLEGRVKDASGNFTDPAEFKEAVVPIVIQEIVRHDLPEEEWQKLAEIDWYDIKQPFPENWDTMTDNDFEAYLENKEVNNLAVARSINNLRKRMTVLYDPDLPTASRLIEQYKIALPTISGQNRRNYFVVPFTKHGFTD